MKTILKKIYQWTQKLVESIISLLSVLFFSSFKVDGFFKKQQKIRKEGDVCVILGNGASLKSYLASSPSNADNIMVVNFFANTHFFRELKPSMYIVLDNILINRAEREYDKDEVCRLYDNIQNVDWPLTFYYPSNGDQNVALKLKQNKNISVIVYNMTPISGFKRLSQWLYSKSLGMPFPMNISNAAVFCMLNSGFKKILLYGVEHSWLKSFDVDPKSHRIYLNDGHFYNEDEIEWFKRGEYCKRLMEIHIALKSHFMLRDYADSIGAKIINKTPTSFIEAYEFDEY